VKLPILTKKNIIYALLALLVLAVMLAWPRGVDRYNYVDSAQCATCGGVYRYTSKYYGAPYAWLTFNTEKRTNYGADQESTSSTEINYSTLSFNILCWSLGVGVVILLFGVSNLRRDANNRN
jgi:hypothetical protein